MRRSSRFIVLSLLFVCAQVHAQRSYFALYDQDTGLNVGEIAALAQDDTGFLWIGAHRGLIRFDGHTFVPWASETLDEVVYQLLYGPSDELLVRGASGHGWRRTGHGLDPLIGPDGKPVADLNSIAFDARGRLWAVLGTSLWRRDTGAHWTRIDGRMPADEKAQRIYATRDGVVALTDQGAWRIDDDGARDILRAHDLWFAAQAADGALWIATHIGTGLWRIDDSGAHALARTGGRALDLRARGSTMWLSLDRTLVAYEAGGAVRAMGIADGLPSGGPLLVDRENSLWLGTFVGLVQIPQPDTWRWGEAEGLPFEHTYSIVTRGDDVIVATWTRLAHLDRDAKRFVPDFPSFGGVVCNDARGGLWTSDGAHLMHWVDGHFDVAANWTSKRILSACVRDAAGTLWLATSRGFSRLSDASPAPRDTDIDGGIDQVWMSGGVLHAAADTRVCRVTVSGDSVALDDCVAFPTEARANYTASISPNETWIAANDGIFGFDGRSVVRLPGNHLSEGGVASSLSPSADGDWWMAGSGILLRVHPCNDCAAKWQVRDAPGRWQGLPGNSAIAVSEDAGGALWIAGNRGIWRVPPQARVGPTMTPRVVPVRIAVDGDAQPLDGELRIRPEAHRIELEFAALSYRDRSLLRYRSRLGDDADWSAPTRSPILQFADLEPGDYSAQMAASLDGEHWSVSPALVAFGVLPPWYRTIWATLLFIAVAVTLAAWLYRLRVAALLRVERERTRIAMDLHDELGSGLGSIGMLAGVAAREGVDTVEARQLVREIADLSGLLGSGLRSLVWSLRSGRAGIGELGSQIADHARRLFPGDVPRLAVNLPQNQSSAPLAPELRRHVLLFALEALHNVARHAQAKHVSLTLEPVGDDGLRLAIEDDGGGFDPAASSRGTGLESMRRRAAAIAATMRVDTTRGQGTRIALERRPQTA
jgi:signal transduction histidine kinase/ligand-binding sensor domain-containing protein